MDEFGLKYAELQFLWNKEIGDLDATELRTVKHLLEAHDMQVPCISRHNFVGLDVQETSISDAGYQQQLDAFKRCIDTAHTLNCPLIRIMGFRKEMVLFGSGGAEHWNVAAGAWDSFIGLVKPAVDLATNEGITVAIETGNGGMVNSAYLGAKLIDSVQSTSLQVLWDPANCLFCNEVAFPEGYQAIRNCVAHIHIKDTLAYPERATLEQREYGTGGLASDFVSIAKALYKDNYQGVISFESVYQPENGSFEDGFRTSISSFIRDFGGKHHLPL